MADFTYYSGSYYLGTFGNDHLEAGPGEYMVIGLGGNDNLVSRGGGMPSLVTLAGGRGNDTYHAGADITVIMDTGGHDRLYLPGYAEDFYGAFVENRDLVLVNEWTGKAVMIYDFKGSGRIEQLIDYAGDSYSGAQVQKIVDSEGYNITYQQLQMITGDYSLNLHEYHAAREIDLAMSRLSWSNVFLHLEERGSVSNDAIADAIQYEIMPLLSPAGQQFWHNSGAYQSLLESEFHGIDGNVTIVAANPVAQAIVEQIALLYEAALDRAPDTAGLNYWVDIAQEGHSVIDIAGYFLMSDEFQEVLGEELGDSHYLDQLYLNVLGRTADSAGHDYWTTQFQEGLTRQEVLLYFADSEENRDNAQWLAGLAETGDGSWVIG